jgi:hypothetical protein
MSGSIRIATSNQYFFNNTSNSDMCIFTTTANQQILIGTSNSSIATLTLNSNNIYVNGDINFNGILKQNNLPYIGSQWSNNSSNVSITGSNVGLNTSSPSNLLTISGAASIGSGYTHTIAPTNGLIVQGTTGIGLTTPNSLYSMAINTNLQVNAINNTINKLFVLYDNGPTDSIATACNFSGFGISSYTLRYQVPVNQQHQWWNGASTVMTLSNGFLGIGTINPSNYLSVAGATSVGSLYTNITGPGNGLIVQGFTGIGTSNPLYALDVNGDLNFNGTLRQNGAAYIGSQWSNNSSNVWITGSNVSIGTLITSNLLTVAGSTSVGYSNLAPTSGLIVKGNTGIGTSNPLYTLDVNGDLNFNGTLRQNGAAYIGSQWSNNSSNVWITGSNVSIGTLITSNLLTVAGSTSVGYSNLAPTSGLIVKGNTGIGTSNPLATLDVNGTVNISGITTVASNIMPLSNLVYDLGSSNMRFRSIYLGSNTIDMSSVQIHVDSGNLRITNSNNSNATLIVSQIQLGNASNAVTLSLDTNNNISFASVTLSNGVSVASSNATVSGWSNYSSNIYIMGSNIAIGKSNAAYPMDIVGDLNFSGTLRQNNLPYVGSQWSNNSSNVWISGSNIGIGLSNPAATLDVKGTLNISSNLSLGGGLSVQGLSIIKNTGTMVNITSTTVTGLSNDLSGVNFLINSNTSNNYFKFIASNSELMRLTGNGYLGIGLSNPSYPLHVVGNYSNISIYANYDITTSSDIRIKTDFKKIDNALDKIQKISGYTYLRTDASTSTRSAGVIAQEILEVLPEVIHKDSQTGYLSVAYGNLSALFIEAIKELQNEIIELRTQINNK